MDQELKEEEDEEGKEGGVCENASIASILLTILFCLKGACCWKTTTKHVESCQSADVVKIWSDTSSDGGGSAGGCEGGV